MALDEVESVVPFRFAFPAAWATSESGELRAEDFIEFLPIVLQLLENSDNLDVEELLALQDQLGTDIELNDAAAVDFATLDDHVDPEFVERDLELSALPNAIYIVDEFAEEKNLSIGDTFSALFIDLQSEDLVVAGIYENGFVLGNRVVTLELWERHFPGASDNLLTVVTASGVSEEDARAAIESELADDFPIVEVQNREEFAAAAELMINQTLATVNVLLGLSGIVAALGILIALSIGVRTHARDRPVPCGRQQSGTDPLDHPLGRRHDRDLRRLRGNHRGSRRRHFGRSEAARVHCQHRERAHSNAHCVPCVCSAHWPSRRGVPSLGGRSHERARCGEHRVAACPRGCRSQTQPGRCLGLLHYSRSQSRHKDRCREPGKRDWKYFLHRPALR